tara:strand:- start:318 stop:533 length:216 start_codon:yes stop_codon:yes gene_type:complete
MKMKWTLKEERDGTTWWVIRGGAFSNVINSKYPHRLWDDKDEIDMYCSNMNRRSNRKCEVVEVRHRDGKKY